MRSIQLVPVSDLVAVSIDRVEVEMGPLQLIILFVMVHHIRDSALLVEASLIGSGLGEVRFNDVELGLMAPAVAI